MAIDDHLNTNMTLTRSLIEYHMMGEFDFLPSILLEASGWTLRPTKGYSKGVKKYGNDARVMSALDELIKFITNLSQQPRIAEYPQQYYVHAIASDKRFGKGTLWAHLKGQKIGVLFNPDYAAKELQMLMLGTHQDLGWR